LFGVGERELKLKSRRWWPGVVGEAIVSVKQSESKKRTKRNEARSLCAAGVVGLVDWPMGKPARGVD